MKISNRSKVVLLALTFASSSVLAKGNFKAGVAYDLDGGLTAQYSGHRFFLNGDAIAIDYHFHHFTNDNNSLHFYIDLGAFIENYDRFDVDGAIGIRCHF